MSTCSLMKISISTLFMRYYIRYSRSFAAIFLILFLFLVIPSPGLTANQDQDSLQIQSPVFSHKGGFFSEPFNLLLETEHTGTYNYKVEKTGYQSVHGEVNIVDQDVDILVTLQAQGNKENTFDLSPEKASAKSFQVTFQVDMIDSPYQSGDVVYISGTMADPQWPEPGSSDDMILEPLDEENNIFGITFQLAPGNYAYKYFLNAGWGGGEWGGDPNRVVSVYGPATFHDVWGVIDPVDEPDDPVTYSVTFVVNDQDGLSIDDATVTFYGTVYPQGIYQIEDVIPAAVIRYTTDGSIPGRNSPVYDSPVAITDRSGDPNVISMIPTNNIGPGHVYNEHWQEPAGEIFKINTIRARAFLPNGYGGQAATHSYLVHESGNQRYSMPLISINAHAGAFFDADTGIYVHGNHNNYFQRGEEWERLVHLEFFESNGNLAFSQEMGARIHGGTSRNRPRKSLRMYARSDYGTTWVDYPLFPNKEIHRYKRFLLRNSGNDWGDAIIRDAFMQSLFKGFGLDMQYSRPAIVFINGEYWGVHNIRDRLDNRYIQTHYGLDDEMDYTILERHGELDRGNPAGVQHYWDMLDFLESPGVADPENYAEIKTRMDVGNFINYQIGQIYVMNTDWPGNNIQYWRYYTDTYDPNAPFGLDGRWRWQVFDLDFGFGLNFDYVTGVQEGPAHNTLTFALEPNGPDWPNPPWSTFILRKLMENQNFQYQFIARFADLLNTDFKASYVLQQLESWRELYLPEMPEHIHRWRMPDGMDHWEAELAVMRDFATRRPGYMRQYLAEEFGLGEETNLHVSLVNPTQGSVRVNTTEIGTEGQPWTGVYFKNMEIQLQALPGPGHRFSHWDGLEDTLSPITGFTLEEETSVTAYFQDALLHYWHFNNLPDGHLEMVEADYSASGAAHITYPGTGNGYMDRTDGTLLNAHQGYTAGYGLRVRNPSDTRELLIQAPSVGYEELIFSFASHRTTNGARQQELYYSPDDGQTWTQLGDAYDIEPEFQLYTFDLRHLDEVNDNPGLQFKIVFTGPEASGPDGNNRFDNVVLSGTAINLTINKTNPPAAFMDETYLGHYFSASGGSPPYTFEITNGSIPPGMHLSSGGHLSGTPADHGFFEFTVTVSDQEGAQDAHTYELNVEHKSVIYYWHFNDLPEGTLYNVKADYYITDHPATISYPGTGNGYMDRTDGTLLNARFNAGAGYGLRVRNPSNTRELIFDLSSRGYEQLEFSFALHRTSNGARQQELYYSADGGIHWNLVAYTYNIGTSFDVYSYDLSDFAAANDNPDLKLKILFTGPEASGTSGNNRFDNVVLHGTRKVVSVEDNKAAGFGLGQNHPNPFRGKTTIPFTTRQEGHVRIDVFNLYGMHVANLADGFHGPGQHQVVFDGSTLPGGVYIIRLQSSGQHESRQMILVR